MKAFRFELTKVQVPAIRERVVAQLRRVFVGGLRLGPRGAGAEGELEVEAT